MQARRRNVVLAAVVLPVLAVIGLSLYWFVYLGAPFWDEWHCSKGNSPVNFEGGGGICKPNDAKLRAGESWDPLGNRPFSCDGRRGWTVIHRDDEDDCLRDGRKMPDGWSEGPVGR